MNINQGKIFSHKPKFKHHNNLRYSSKNYSNPFFNKKRKRGKLQNPNFLIKILTLGAFFLAGSILYFFVYSGVFKVKINEIRYNGKVPMQEIEQKINEQKTSNKFIFLPQSNMFILNTESLKNTLLNKFNFEEVKIIKKYPNKLIVDISEKQPAYIWTEDGKNYYIDKNGGIIIEILSGISMEEKLPIIENDSSLRIQNSKVHADINSLQFISNLDNIIIKYKNDFNVRSYVMGNELFSIKMKIENGPIVYFSTNADVEKQLTKLIGVKTQELKNEFFKKEYINLTIEDRVYYK